MSSTDFKNESLHHTVKSNHAIIRLQDASKLRSCYYCMEANVSMLIN